MKKTTISMLITALILFCTGLLVTLITLIYTTATGTDIFSGQNTATPNVRDYTQTFADMGYKENDLIKKIDFSMLVGKVEVAATTQESRVEFTQTDINNIVCSFENNTLTVKEINSVAFMGFEISENGMGFNGLRQLFRSVGNASSDRKAVLYINPKDFGGVINVKCVVGSITCQDLNCEDLSTESTIADVSVMECSFLNEIKIKGTAGDVYLRKNTYSNCRVNVTSGNIFAIIDQKKHNFETTVGDILILTQQDKEDYLLRLSNTYGAIRPFDYENSANEFSLYSEENNDITAKSLLGSITIQKYNEEQYPDFDYSAFSDLTKIPVRA